MSAKKRNGPRTPAEVQADIERAPEQNLPGTDPLHEALALVQQARDLEVSRGRTAALPEGCFTLQRLMIAVLESMTPEQRAEVRRRLG